MSWSAEVVKFKKISLKTDAICSCPACKCPVSEVAYLYDDGERKNSFYRCPECTFIFARPVFIPELDNRQMDGVDNAEMFNSRFLKFIYTHWFIKKEMRQIRKLKPLSGAKLLDIGCGTGWTSKVYADNGFDVTGLEPSAIRAQLARERYGLNVVNEYIENSNLGKTFDVVVLRHIIEHFADPAVVLQQVKGLLKEDGVVLLVVPNINCLGRYLFETDWAWILPWHCNFFTPQSLRRLLETEGYAEVAFYQTPSPLYFPGSFMRKFPAFIGNAILKKSKVFSMLAFAPLALIGSWFGQGDNLNILVRVK